MVGRPVGEAGGRLVAIGDLHVGYAENRALVEELRPESPADWLLVAGDVADTVADI
jgi:predicted phosphodiesterase